MLDILVVSRSHALPYSAGADDPEAGAPPLTHYCITDPEGLGDRSGLGLAALPPSSTPYVIPVFNLPVISRIAVVVDLITECGERIQYS